MAYSKRVIRLKRKLLKMNFLANTLAVLTLAILVLLSMWSTKNTELKEKIKENYDLRDENYNLRKKIDELKEELRYVKERHDMAEETIKELTEYPEENNNLKDEGSE